MPVPCRSDPKIIFSSTYQRNPDNQFLLTLRFDVEPLMAGIFDFLHLAARVTLCFFAAFLIPRPHETTSLEPALLEAKSSRDLGANLLDHLPQNR